MGGCRSILPKTGAVPPNFGGAHFGDFLCPRIHRSFGYDHDCRKCTA